MGFLSGITYYFNINPRAHNNHYDKSHLQQDSLE